MYTSIQDAIFSIVKTIQANYINDSVILTVTLNNLLYNKQEITQFTSENASYFLVSHNKKK